MTSYSKDRSFISRLSVVRFKKILFTTIRKSSVPVPKNRSKPGLLDRKDRKWKSVIFNRWLLGTGDVPEKSERNVFLRILLPKPIISIGRLNRLRMNRGAYRTSYSTAIPLSRYFPYYKENAFHSIQINLKTTIHLERELLKIPLHKQWLLTIWIF